MTAIGKLLRATAFRLTLVYLLVFALFAVCLLAYFAFNTRRLITQQITQTVDAEITGLTEQYNLGGIRRTGIHDPNPGGFGERSHQPLPQNVLRTAAESRKD